MDLYHKYRGDRSAPGSGLSLIPKIKLEHIQLNSFSKMKVRLAVQVRNLTPCTWIGINLQSRF